MENRFFMSSFLDKRYFLERQAIFKDLPGEIIELFINNGIFLSFLQGELISPLNTTVESVYMIVNGNVKAYQEDIVLEGITLGSGDFFDLVSFFNNVPSKGSYFAHGPVEVYSWDKEFINKLLKKYPEIYEVLSRLLTNSLENLYNEKMKYAQKQYEKRLDTDHSSVTRLLDEKDDELETIFEVGKLLNSFENLEELFQKIVEKVPRFLRAKGCILRLLDENEDVLKIKAASGVGREILKGKTQKTGEGVAGWVLSTGRAALINDISKDPRFSNNTKSIASSLINVPLMTMDKTVGTLTIFDKKDSHCPKFTNFDVKLLSTIGNQVAVAIDNFMLHKKIDFANQSWGETLRGKLSLIKKAPVLRKIFPKVMSAAEDNLTFTLFGEDGSGKSVLAEAVHYLSSRREKAFVYVDCSKIPEDSMGQEIFGLEDFSRDKDLVQGKLGDAHHGTLCLDNFEMLNRMNQAKLLHFLKNHIYSPVGKTVRKISDVKLILLSSLRASEAFSEKILLPEISNLLRDNFIYIPPLRERNRDIPILIDHFIGKISSERHCGIKKLSTEALGLLLNYEWPGNIDELENVLARAVMLAEGDTIRTEHIMFGLPKLEEKNEFNLLKIPLIKKIFEHRLYPGVFKVFSLFLGFGIIYSSFWGSPVVEENFALWICWTIGWPVLFTSFILVGRVWCGICPFHFTGKQAKRLMSLELETPVWVKNNKHLLGLVFCLLIVWFERVTNIHTSPFYTGSLMVMILLGAGICGVFFKRRIWCLYICPWGALNRILSACSLTSIRANRSICYSQCKEHSCYKGKDGREGCVMEQHPYNLDNKDCVLCGNCIKNCDYNSILLTIRPIGRSLWKWSENHLSDSLLGISLASVLIVDKVMKTETYMSMTPKFMMAHDQVFYSIFFLLGIYGAYIVLKKVGSMIGESPEEIKAFTGKIGYAFVPVSLFGYMVSYLRLAPYSVHIVLLSAGILMSFYTMCKILSHKKGGIKRKLLAHITLLVYSAIYLTVF